MKGTYSMMLNPTIIRQDAKAEGATAAGGLVTITKLYDAPHLSVVFYDYNREPGSLHLRTPVEPGGLKTYLLLTGQVEIVVTGEIIHPGDLVILKYEDEWVNVKLSTGTRMLVHAYGENVFETTIRTFKDAYETLDQIQEKDNYTNDHNQRVYQLAQKMALKMGYTGNRFRNIQYAARFHDVGKVFVSDEILNKPGQLTPQEYQIMKAHVENGRQLVAEKMGHAVYNIMALHHERLDGSGYPLGLTADSISEDGRILAVVDTYDAMTTNRVYKNGKSPQEAIGELRQLAPHQYDQQVVEVLAQVLAEDGLLE